MQTETDKFIFDNVDHIWRESEEITTTPRPPMKVGVRSVDVYCKSCGHVWNAKRGDGSLDNVIGGLLVRCPQCGADEGSIKLP
jgi:hypothetical protein